MSTSTSVPRLSLRCSMVTGPGFLTAGTWRPDGRSRVPNRDRFWRPAARAHAGRPAGGLDVRHQASSSSSSPGEAIAAASGRKARRYSRGMKQLVRCQRSVFGFPAVQEPGQCFSPGLAGGGSASHADRGLRAMSPVSGLVCRECHSGRASTTFCRSGNPKRLDRMSPMGNRAETWAALRRLLRSPVLIPFDRSSWMVSGSAWRTSRL